MKKNSIFGHLSLIERERIGFYKVEGKSARTIGRLLNRDHTTISRELKRNDRPHKLMQGYVGVLAHDLAKTRKIRSSQRLRLKNDFIRGYVRDKLSICWTPEEISNRLSMDHKEHSISTEAIYQYIYADFTDGRNYLATAFS